MAKKRSDQPLLEAFGNRLFQLRSGRSREVISRRLKSLGVPLGGSTLGQYEKGGVWAPDAGVLWGLAKIYGVDLEELILLLRANRLSPSTVDPIELDLRVGLDSAYNALRERPAPEGHPSSEVLQQDRSDKDLASPRATLVRILADLTALAEQLPGGQTAVAGHRRPRSPPSHRKPRGKSNRAETKDPPPE